MKLRKKEEEEEAVLSDLILCEGEVHMQHCFLVFFGTLVSVVLLPPMWFGSGV